MKLCQASELEALIAATPDGEVCRLERREYYIRRRVELRGRCDLVVEGNGALIVTEYNNSADYKRSADAFLIEDCRGLTLRNLVIDTDAPTNVTATVEAVNAEAETITLLVDSAFSMTGNEIFMAFGSVDEENSFDYRLHHYEPHPDPDIVTLVQNEILLAKTYAGAPYTYLGNNRFAVKIPAQRLTNLKGGERVCIRHTVYGPSVVVIRHSDDTVLENITMHAAPGMGVMVLPRCHNLTVDGLRMVCREGSDMLMSCNCDGIHMTGLTGRFVLRNSVFDGLGDDALNVHSTAGTVSAVDMAAHTARCHYSKKMPDGELAAAWCRKGDRIRIFDPKNVECVGEMTVVDFCRGVLVFSDLCGRLEEGFCLQNMAFAPSCLVEHCEVRNTRSRGLIFQTEDVEVKNCTFFGMSASAIKATVAFDYWYEVGPVDGLYIHDNRFVKNAFRGASLRPVLINAPKMADKTTVPYGLHKNVRIEKNTFEGTPTAYIEVQGTDGVCIHDNVFLDREAKDSICLVNCRDVSVQV